MYSRSANYKPANNMDAQKIVPSQTISLSKPLKIDVSKIASFMPGCRYRGPFTLNYPKMACTSEAVLSDSNSDKQVVLLFDGKTQEGFTKIVSAYSSKELAFLLSKFPKELSGPFASSLKGTMLEIPQLSADELAHYQQKADKEKILDIEFKKLQQPLKNAKKVDFKKEQSIMVLQHEYAVTTATSKRPILGTFGAGPCVILALYDESKSTAILAHIDASTDIASLFSLIKQTSSGHTVAHLAGGIRSSKDMCLAIVEMLKKNNINIVNADIVRSLGIKNAASLAIDARTGTIYSPVSPDQLEKTADMELRIRIAGMQFMKSALARYESPESSAIKKEKSKSLLREFAHFGSSEPRLKQHPEQKYDLEQQVEQAIGALLGTECQVINMMESEQIISFLSEKSYEQLEEYAKILASLDLAVIAKKPLILDDGFEAVSAKLICKNSLNTILEKLQPKVDQNFSR